MAAARLLHRRVLATDIEPWSVRVAQQNATLNRLGRLVRVRLADGWRHPAVRAGGPYDLVFANILARPLCLMARQLARASCTGRNRDPLGPAAEPGAGVLAAHLRCGLGLEADIQEGPGRRSYCVARRRVPRQPAAPSVGDVVAATARSAANAGSKTRGRSAA